MLDARTRTAAARNGILCKFCMHAARGRARETSTRNRCVLWARDVRFGAGAALRSRRAPEYIEINNNYKRKQYGIAYWHRFGSEMWVVFRDEVVRRMGMGIENISEDTYALHN